VSGSRLFKAAGLAAGFAAALVGVVAAGRRLAAAQAASVAAAPAAEASAVAVDAAAVVTTSAAAAAQAATPPAAAAAAAAASTDAAAHVNDNHHHRPFIGCRHTAVISRATQHFAPAPGRVTHYTPLSFRSAICEEHNEACVEAVVCGFPSDEPFIRVAIRRGAYDALVKNLGGHQPVADGWVQLCVDSRRWKVGWRGAQSAQALAQAKAAPHIRQTASSSRGDLVSLGQLREEATTTAAGRLRGADACHVPVVLIFEASYARTTTDSRRQSWPAAAAEADDVAGRGAVWRLGVTVHDACVTSPIEHVALDIFGTCWSGAGARETGGACVLPVPRQASSPNELRRTLVVEDEAVLSQELSSLGL